MNKWYFCKLGTRCLSPIFLSWRICQALYYNVTLARTEDTPGWPSRAHTKKPSVIPHAPPVLTAPALASGARGRMGGLAERSRGVSEALLFAFLSPLPALHALRGRTRLGEHGAGDCNRLHSKGQPNAASFFQARPWSAGAQLLTFPCSSASLFSRKRADP